MNVAVFIARRLAFNQQPSFSRFIIRLAIVATVISVAAMLLTLAFTNGFQFAISQKVFSFWGHIRVQRYQATKSLIAEDIPITPNDTVLKVLHANPEITAIQAYANKTAIIKGKEGIDGIMLKGVESTYHFSNLDGFLKQGRWLHFPDSGISDEIDLSAYTAKQLKLKVNDKALIYFIQPDGSRRVRSMRIAGIFKTGIEDYDKFAIGDLRLIQRLNNWQADQIGGYEIFVKDYRRTDSVSQAISEALPPTWNCRTSEEANQNIFDWLNLQNTTIAIALIIMIVIATLNLVTCLIILVLDRTRMIGILKAIGSPDASIRQIFLYHGSIITLSGLFFGNLTALLICELQQHYGFISLPEDAYFISKAVVKLEWWHFVLVNAGTFLVCFAVLMIPTVIIRNIQPAKAIQFR